MGMRNHSALSKFLQVQISHHDMQVTAHLLLRLTVPGRMQAFRVRAVTAEVSQEQISHIYFTSARDCLAGLRGKRST